MKTIIVTQQPVNSICGLEEFQKKLTRESNTEVSCLQYVPGKSQDIIGEIKSRHPDLLITTDLAGFEQCTLTDNISYNLLDCKQFHLLLHEDLPNEPYLKKQLSIAMFFFCTEDVRCEELIRKYPNLPCLKEMSGWQKGTERGAGERNAEILFDAFQEILQECGIQS